MFWRGLRVSVVVAAVGLSVHCGGEASNGGGASGSGGTGGSAGSGGSAGGGNECTPVADECYVSGPSGPGHECLAKQDNAALPTAQFRWSMMAVDSPPVLSQPFMQDAIITTKINLAQPSCATTGTGQFNVLMEVDEANQQLTIGGGTPHAQRSPKDEGACYAEFTDTGSGLLIGPTTVAYTVEAGQAVARFTKLVLPIFLDDSVDNYVLLPVNDVVIRATLSADKNCVGRFAPENLDPEFNCAPDIGAFAWEGGGTFEGYITTREADSVDVVSLGQTLCVILSGDIARWKGEPGHECASEGGGAPSMCADCASADINAGVTDPAQLQYPRGDYCSTTKSAATDACHDAFLLRTTFAASAMKIGASCN